MPKYPLIISNKNYVKCLQICAQRGCSMGRLLNDIVNEAIRKYDTEKPEEPKCVECGRTPVYEGYTNDGKRLYYCDLHFENQKLRAYKKIGN